MLAVILLEVNGSMHFYSDIGCARHIPQTQLYIQGIRCMCVKGNARKHEHKSKCKTAVHVYVWLYALPAASWAQKNCKILLYRDCYASKCPYVGGLHVVVSVWQFGLFVVVLKRYLKLKVNFSFSFKQHVRPIFRV